MLLGAVVPFTLLVILPTNNHLLDPSLDKTSPEAGALLARWGWLHAVRSVMSLVAFATFLILLDPAGDGLSQRLGIARTNAGPCESASRRADSVEGHRWAGNRRHLKSRRRLRASRIYVASTRQRRAADREGVDA